MQRLRNRLNKDLEEVNEMIDRMSEISEQIENLRNLSDGYIIGGHKNIGNKLKEAADTIDVLSAKLTTANMELESLYESGVNKSDRNKDSEIGMTENITKTINQMLQEISEDICNNYCKYRNTGDEDCLCELIRDGRDCPLDKLS